jgi:hypothetical protein
MFLEHHAVQVPRQIIVVGADAGSDSFSHIDFASLLRVDQQSGTRGLRRRNYYAHTPQRTHGAQGRVNEDVLPCRRFRPSPAKQAA